MELTRREAELVREWFDAVRDLNPAYLDYRDYLLANRVYKFLGGHLRRVDVDKMRSLVEQPVKESLQTYLHDFPDGSELGCYFNTSLPGEPFVFVTISWPVGPVRWEINGTFAAPLALNHPECVVQQMRLKRDHTIANSYRP